MKHIIRYNATEVRWEIVSEDFPDSPISMAVGLEGENPWDLEWTGGVKVQMVDTADATALAADIAEGKTAYINGELVTGTGTVGGSVTEGELTATPAFVAEGFTFIGESGAEEEGTMEVYDIYEVSMDKIGGGNAVPVDGYVAKITVPGLTTPRSSDIRYGATVLGVAGSFSYECDATASDIANGKTAAVNGEVVTGTYVPTSVTANMYQAILVVEFSSSTGVPDGVVGQTISLYPYSWADQSFPSTRVWQGTSYNSQGSVVYHTIYYDGTYSVWMYTVGASSTSYDTNTAIASYANADTTSDPWSENGTIWAMNSSDTTYMCVHAVMSQWGGQPSDPGDDSSSSSGVPSDAVFMMEGLTSASGGTNSDSSKDASTANGYYKNYNGETGTAAIYKHVTNDWYIFVCRNSCWALKSSPETDDNEWPDHFIRRTAMATLEPNPYSAEGVTWYISGIDGTADGTATSV